VSDSKHGDRSKAANLQIFVRYR